MSLFPYDKPRPFQDELIQRIYTADKLLCNAPTGVGKSISALCGFLADREEDEKIIILTRTKSQADIFLKETARISRHTGIQYLAVQLRSKQELCPLFKDKETTYEEFIELCKLSTECPYRERFFDSAGALGALAGRMARTRIYADYQAFLSIALEYGCPYLVVQDLAPKADLLVTSYLYLLNPFLRRIFLGRLQKDIEDLLLIVDEAHNLQSLDLLGKQLSKRTVDFASKELNYDFSNIYSLLDGGDSLLDLRDLIDPNEIQFLLDRGREILQRRLKKGKKISYTFRVATFLDNAIRLCGEKNWIFFRKEGRLFIKPLFPNEFIKPLKNARKLLLMSGTLEPIEGYKILYGLEEAEEISLPRIFPRENCSYFGVKGINTGIDSREKKGDELWGEYGRAIREIAEVTPKTTLVFFPSYDIMREVANYSEAVMEPGDSSEAENFWKTIRNKEKRTVFAVSGGKLSEGVEFTVKSSEKKESIVSTLVIAGLPFPVPDFELEIKGKLYEEKFGYGKSFLLLSVLPMVNKVMQAMGRAIRSENDRAAVVILDDRLEYLRYFPEEVREEIQIYHVDEIKLGIEEFHRSKESGKDEPRGNS